MKAALGPVVAGTFLVAMFAFFFAYPGHDPNPNELPVGVVGQPPRLPAEGFDVRPYPTEAAAREAILDREIYFAVIGERVLVASAASYVVTQIAAAGRDPANVVDVRPLDPDDPRGISLNLTILPLSIASILGAMLLVLLAPALTAGPRIAALGLFSVLGGAALAGVVNAGLGAIPGSFLAVAGIAALAIASTAAAASGIIQLVGGPGIMLSFLIFLMLGAPASGTASAPELLPDPWKDGGQFLPAGAAASALRNVAYFDGAKLTQPLIVLAAYAALGVLLIFAAQRRGGPLVPLGPPPAPPHAASAA